MTIADERRSRTGVLGQGAMLAGGYFAAQCLSFLRNAIIGHALSKGDFGVAATITLILQLIEMISDMGSDRLIVQATDGASDLMLASSHTILVLRGLLVCAILFVAGPLLARLFDVPTAALTFQLAGVASLIRGFTHLDWRRAQRRLDNGPHLAIEIVPQAVSLAATVPMVIFVGGYSAVVWLSIVQALTAVTVSHALTRSSYRLGFDRDMLKRQIAFGWPILASALPLTAVYQFDRIVIGGAMGVEALANYTVAFLATMIPGILAAKVGHALMLPVFSTSRRTSGSLRLPFEPMAEGVVVIAAMYLVGFIICGEHLLPLTFGQNYVGLGVVSSWLAAMWALRMIQSAPGMAIMAAGETRPFMVAATLRAGALPLIVVAAHFGATLAQIAAVGCAFEAVSLLYIAWKLEAIEAGLGRVLVLRAGLLVPAALGGLLIITFGVPNAGVMLLAAAAASTLTGLVGLAVMPSLRTRVRQLVSGRDGVAQAA